MKVSDNVYVNSKPKNKTLEDENGKIFYIIQKLIYYVTEPFYNEKSKPSKLWILVIESIVNRAKHN